MSTNICFHHCPGGEGKISDQKHIYDRWKGAKLFLTIFKRIYYHSNQLTTTWQWQADYQPELRVGAKLFLTIFKKNWLSQQ